MKTLLTIVATLVVACATLLTSGCSTLLGSVDYCTLKQEYRCEVRDAINDELAKHSESRVELLCPGDDPTMCPLEPETSPALTGGKHTEIDVRVPPNE